MKCLVKIKIVLVSVFFIATAMVLGSTTILYAENELPYTFSSGTTISSAQVNANFQELLAQIAALRGSVSIVGTYDYVAVGGKMLLSSSDASHYISAFEHSGERGEIVFTGNATSGTVTINQTSGGWDQLSFFNEISPVLVATPNITTNKSLITGTLTSGGSSGDSMTYSVSGTTVTFGDGKLGTLSADGKILIISFFDSTNKKTGLAIAIKRP